MRGKENGFSTISGTALAAAAIIAIGLVSGYGDARPGAEERPGR